MSFVKFLLLVASMTMLTSLVAAQAPTPTTPAKIAVIDSSQFADPTNGIKRLIAAQRTLETEFKPRRDEITQLVTRFNALQQVPPNTPQAQLVTRREQAETLQIEIQRKQEDARNAFSKRLATLTNPIRASVYTALEAYTKQRGIDLLIDVSKFPEGVLLANKNVDLTPGFIRDFNAKNP